MCQSTIATRSRQRQTQPPPPANTTQPRQAQERAVYVHVMLFTVFCTVVMYCSRTSTSGRPLVCAMTQWISSARPARLTASVTVPFIDTSVGVTTVVTALTTMSATGCCKDSIRVASCVGDRDSWGHPRVEDEDSTRHSSNAHDQGSGERSQAAPLTRTSYSR